MKDLEMLYFDVDGTLLDNKNNVIPHTTVEALNELKQQGYKLALCTGRNITAIDIVKDLVSWDGYVLSNGCAVYDHNLNLIYEKPFEPDFVSRLIQASHAPLFLEGENIYFSKEPHDKLKKALSFFSSYSNIDILDYDNHKIYNIMSYDYDDLNFEIIPDFDTQADTMFDVLGNVEIIPKDSGKHRGCNVLNSYLNITHYAGFGDGENDIDFLKNAPISVAMGNARDHVKEVAQYITSDVGDHGILNGLKMLGLL
ncbi:hypothetical protein AOC36_05450 [Erysipelothrix larvae]|uniref:Hydrolase n=1 Tax=Erysipelothrix larvae TaxID=1514105 RepID=A0A0X8GZS3_9FIRM|nr:Cof-type HAD-IIB family hydrolase [Erysipelothrix larvae]AMC93444.1 hypothetical protein AOC36_05450 [Erysipelothrix larvae]